MQIATNPTGADIFLFEGQSVWDTESAFRYLNTLGEANTKRTAERRLHELGMLPPELNADILRDEFNRPLNHVVLDWAIDKVRRQRKLVLFAQIHTSPTGAIYLHCNDARGGRYWILLEKNSNALGVCEKVKSALEDLQQYIGKHIAVFPHQTLVGCLRTAESWKEVSLFSSAYLPTVELSTADQSMPTSLPPHLRRLESESIHIMREAVADAERPVMLYSIGKDSSVMLHLARKAFYPAPPPFPLLHVDTRWKFQEMYAFRDKMAALSQMELLVYTNPEAIEKNINPFDHGSDLHTDITKTQALKQALDQYKFDVIFGGARRDEEKSRAKERIFSFRNANHHWDPKQQRPELWNVFNTRKRPGETIRVFPLSNWTELDIWQYIYHENIPVVPLYFAKKRPVVVRDGMMLVVDDGRFRLRPGENITEQMVRFRTLGCYPLTGAIASTATDLHAVLTELLHTHQSERQGRAIDKDTTSSMEKKKQEGYF